MRPNFMLPFPNQRGRTRSQLEENLVLAPLRIREEAGNGESGGTFSWKGIFSRYFRSTDSNLVYSEDLNVQDNSDISNVLNSLENGTLFFLHPGTYQISELNKEITIITVDYFMRYLPLGNYGRFFLFEPIHEVPLFGTYINLGSLNEALTIFGGIVNMTNLPESANGSLNIENSIVLVTQYLSTEIPITITESWLTAVANTPPTLYVPNTVIQDSFIIPSKIGNLYAKELISNKLIGEVPVFIETESLVGISYGSMFAWDITVYYELEYSHLDIYNPLGVVLNIEEAYEFKIDSINIDGTLYLNLGDFAEGFIGEIVFTEPWGNDLYIDTLETSVLRIGKVVNANNIWISGDGYVEILE